jgi:phosphomethylpyrimidine synthase
MPHEHRTGFAADAECRTQMHLACRGVVLPQMARVAEREGLEPELIREEVARGPMVIPANVEHVGLDPMAIGLKARVKVNANIGSSPTSSSISEEVEVDLGEICDRAMDSDAWGAEG